MPDGTFEIPSDSSIAAVEKLLTSLQDSELPKTLLLPTNLRGWEFGGRAALTQFLMTWAQKDSLRVLQTHAQTSLGPESQLHNFISEDHGLVAVIVAKKVLLRDGTNVTKEAKALAKKRLEYMQTSLRHEKLGLRTTLICDDERRDFQFVRPLYQSRHSDDGSDQIEPLSEYELKSVTSSILEANTHGATLNRRAAFVDEMTTILWELFRNTHDWGRENPGRGKVKSSVRMVQVEGFRADQAAVSKAANDPRLHAYITEVNRAVGRPTYFIQLSVLDSGLGLARHWNRGKPIEGTLPGMEYEMVLQCLTKGRSSSSKSGKGYGLYRVLKTLTSANAFMRLRTGRLHLFRNLIKAPYIEGSEPLLSDWVSEEEKNPMLVSPVSGALFTMLIPVADVPQGGQ